MIRREKRRSMIRKDYEKTLLKFQEEVERLSKLPEDQRKFEKEPPTIEVIACCKTPGCSWNEKYHKLEMTFPADGVFRAFCASCRSAIEYLDPMFEDDGEFRLPTRFPDGSPWLLGAS